MNPPKILGSISFSKFAFSPVKEIILSKTKDSTSFVKGTAVFSKEHPF